MYYVLIFIVLSYLLGLLLLWVNQEKFIFFPTKVPLDYRYAEFDHAEEVFLPVSACVKIHALYFRVPNSKGVVLYFHGNSQGLEHWGHMAKVFNDMGYDVFMPDYRGFGKSGGSIEENVLHEDAERAYDYLRKYYDAKDIVLYGRSLGSGIATALAAHKPVRTLILETPYYSILSLVQRKFPFFPTSRILRYPMRSDLYIKKVKCPVYLFHGTEDELIPYQQAVELAETYGKPSILTTVPGGKHGDLNSFPIVREKLEEILSVGKGEMVGR